MTSVVLLWSLLAVYAVSLLSASVICWLLIRRAVRGSTVSKELKELQELLQNVKAWNSRLLSTIRWASEQAPASTRTSATSPAPRPAAQLSDVVGVPVPPAVAVAAAAGGMEEVEVPDAIVNIAKGAGIDVGKVLAGDEAEGRKAKQLLELVSSHLRLNASTAPPAAAAPRLASGFPGPSPGDEYL